MKRAILTVLTVLFILGISTTAKAVTVSGYATADDMFWVWDYNGAGDWNTNSWYPVGGLNNWNTAHNFYGDATVGETINLYFAVKNVYSPVAPWDVWNPAGFLASITTSSGYFAQTGSNKLLTDVSHWEILTHSEWAVDPNFDPTLLTGWFSPVSNGANNSPTVWYTNNANQPIANIDNDAHWLWTNSNFDWATMDKYAVIHTQFTVIPEPATLSLLGLGLLGLAGLRKKAF